MRKFEGVVMIPHRVEFGIQDDNASEKQITESARSLVKQLGNIGDVHSLLLWVQETPCESEDSSPLPPAA